MKKIARKLLCLVLVLMMAMPMIILPTSAEVGDLIDEINFNGGGAWNSDAPTGGWGGMDPQISEDGRSMDLKFTYKKSEGSVWGGALDTSKYVMSKSAYTTVFTVEAEDANQEVGLFLDWKTGFIVKPGQDSFRFGRDRAGTTYAGIEGTYDGTKSLKQTYAIEVEDSGTGKSNYKITAYKLWVILDGKWTLLYSLSGSELTCNPDSALNWSSGDYEYVLRFWRNGTDESQVKKSLIVSNCNVYSGLAVTNRKVAPPTGELIYKANFKGTEDFWTPEQSWAGMKKKQPSSDGSSITLIPTIYDSKGEVVTQGAVWGDDLPYPDYRMLQSAYTVVFTLEADDANQELGLFPDWNTGFILKPGQDSYRYGKYGKETAGSTIFSGSYAGTQALQQTYAIEIKDEGDENDGTKENFEYNITEYNLYVVQDGEWVKLFSLKNSEYASAVKNALTWNSSNYEFVLRLFRNGQDTTQNAGMTVSDLCVYTGLSVSEGFVSASGAYDQHVERIISADFTSDNGGLWSPKKGWAGMNENRYNATTRSIRLVPSTYDADGMILTEGAVWGAELHYPTYRMLQSSYTAVFTVEAENADQEIGFYPDWNTGFILKPGADSFRYGVGKLGETLVDANGNEIKGSYNGNKSLKQTYAIEIMDSGNENDGNVANFEYDITEYNLYVAVDGEWVLIYKFSAPDNEAAAAAIEENLKWNTETAENYEYVLRFYRNGLDKSQEGKYVTISDLDVYKGLGVTAGKISVPMPSSYADANDGELLYYADFNGTSGIWTPQKDWDGWGGIEETILNKHTIEMRIEDGKSGVWGTNLNVSKYPMLKNSYTVVFTLEASDANQEIGFYPDWNSGFILTPGQNAYRFNKSTNEGKNNAVVAGVEGTYGGTKALKQTYAIQISDNGTSTSDFDCAIYNLWVLQDGEWVLVRALTPDELVNDPSTALNWSDKDPEFVLRFHRNALVGNQDGAVTVSGLKVYKGSGNLPSVVDLINGASIRIDEPTGLRFTGLIYKSYIDTFKAKYGEDNVIMGMLITPTDYLTDVEFTKEALDASEREGVKYLEIDALTVLEDGDYYKINCAITNIKSENYERAFSAILYVKVVDGENVEYIYSDYDSENNSRTVADIAVAAYNDLSDVRGTVKNGLTYQYEVETVDGKKYSPYEKRDNLLNFFQQREQVNTLVP